MSLVHRGAPVYVNVDKSKVVDGSSPEAAFLLVGTNGVVKREFLDLYREHFALDGVDAPEPEKPRTVTYGSPSDDDMETDTETEAPEEPEAVAEPEKPRKRTTRKGA